MIKHTDPYKRTLTFNLALFTWLSAGLFGLPSLWGYTWLAHSYAKPGEATPYYLATALTIFLIIFTIIKQRQQLSYFLDELKTKGAFEPCSCDECKGITGDRYIGLDIEKGLLLYILPSPYTLRRLFIPKDYIVMGFDMHSFEKAELRGNRLTIYTGKPDIPEVSIEHKATPQLFNKLSAMHKRRYDHSGNKTGYIDYCAARVAEERNLNLIRSKF